MMSSLLRVVLAIAVAAHGLGHILFLVGLLGIADWGQATQSWLLGSGRLAKGLGAVLWLAAVLGFAAAAAGLYLATDWWRPVAIGAAIVSAAGLIAFWVRPPGSPVVSALVFDLLLVLAATIVRWPSTVQLAGR